MAFAHERARHRFDRLIRLGDWTLVGLGVDLQPLRPEELPGEFVGAVGDLSEEREPVGRTRRRARGHEHAGTPPGPRAVPGAGAGGPDGSRSQPIFCSEP
jgi:hypothetical protein